MGHPVTSTICQSPADVWWQALQQQLPQHRRLHWICSVTVRSWHNFLQQYRCLITCQAPASKWSWSNTGLLHVADRRIEVKSNRHVSFNISTTTANLGVHLCIEGAKPPRVLLDYLLQRSGAIQHVFTLMVHGVLGHDMHIVLRQNMCHQYHHALCSEGLSQMVHPSNHQHFAQMVHLMNTHGCCK